MNRILILLFVCLVGVLGAADIEYRVHFEGIEDQEILSTLKKVSELVTLQESPPATKTALKRRAEADVGNLVKGLHSFGYYNAKVDLRIDTERVPAEITITIDLRGSYPLASFIIVPAEEGCFSFESVTLEKLGIELGEPALPKTILKAEANLLVLLANKGYTLAIIKNREVVADQTAKTVSVKLTVDSGPLVYFGATSIEGLTSVKEVAVRKKIAWSECEEYDPQLVEMTLNDIEATGLFTSVTIDTDEEAIKDNRMPINIQVTEAKHRTIGGGLSYNTQIGPGLIATWQHRNIRGIGERVTMHADIAQKLQTARLLYEEYDFLVPKQNLLWIAEVEAEQTRGFNDIAFGVSALIDRTLSKRFKVSYGADLRWIEATKTAKEEDGKVKKVHGDDGFFVLKFPLLGRWSTANSILNPTRGKTILLKMAPAEVMNRRKFYCINTITALWYIPLTDDDRFILAAKASLGSIWGTSDISIPPPERFYLGSETTLRGYNYLTVSPLVDNKPIGGRSMMLYVLEARYRLNEEFGLVAFFEEGNAYESTLPRFDKKIFGSVGGGLRYHTSVGPLRFDVAFPLNRRAKIDRSFQFYLSIGQSF